MTIPAGSSLLRGAFVFLAVALALLFVGAVYVSFRRDRRVRDRAARHAFVAAVVSTAWMATTGLLAARGLLHFEPPPTMLVLLVAMFVLAIVTAFSPAGRRIALSIPLWALVGFQGFRIVVELLLHRAYVEGLMPVQMSYSGYNFDIVSGITALAVGAWLATGRGTPRLVTMWNVLGLLLLANIIVVALLSAPTPFRVFMNEPPNVWVTRAPWVWLPTVMVFAAIVGHILVFRRLNAVRARRVSF